MTKPSPPPHGCDLTLEDLIRSSIARGRPTQHNFSHPSPALPVPVRAPSRRRRSESERAVVLASMSAVLRPPPPRSQASAWVASGRPRPAGSYNEDLRQSLRQVLESVLDELEDSPLLDGDDEEEDVLMLGRRNGPVRRRHSNGSWRTMSADNDTAPTDESESDSGDGGDVDDAMGH